LVYIINVDLNFMAGITMEHIIMVIINGVARCVKILAQRGAASQHWKGLAMEISTMEATATKSPATTNPATRSPTTKSRAI
jgi:hypothetical protein